MWRYAIEDAAGGAMVWRDARGEIAAFMAETVIGSGGFIVPPKEYFKRATEIAKKYGTQKSSQFINGILDGILKRYNLAGT